MTTNQQRKALAKEVRRLTRLARFAARTCSFATMTAVYATKDRAEKALADFEAKEQKATT